MRICDECGCNMISGYLIENGDGYYCSDKCLEKNMTRAEFLELYDDGEGDSYYTDWEDECDFEVDDFKCSTCGIQMEDREDEDVFYRDGTEIYCSSKCVPNLDTATRFTFGKTERGIYINIKLDEEQKQEIEKRK